MAASENPELHPSCQGRSKIITSAGATAFGLDMRSLGVAFARVRGLAEANDLVAAHMVRTAGAATVIDVYCIIPPCLSNLSLFPQLDLNSISHQPQCPNEQPKTSIRHTEHV